MRILHVISSVSPSVGGPASALKVVTENLAKAGVFVEIATTNADRDRTLDVPTGQAVERNGVTYWYFERQTQFYTYSWPLTAWLKRRVRDFDVIHVHGLFSYAPLAAAGLAKAAGIPYIIRPFGTLNRWGMVNRRAKMKKLSFRMIESRMLRSAAVVHFTSEQERVEAIEQRVPMRTAIIPNPVEAATWPREALRGVFRAQHPSLRSRKIILFLSRLDPKKGLDLLLPAFRKVLDKIPDCALVIAGSGDPDFVDSLHAIARSLALDQHILWTGFVSGQQKWSVMADADMFFLPSYSENFGIAVAEAMSYGLPVVVTDQVALHTEITSSQAGLTVQCDAEELAQAMTQLLLSPERGAQMGRNGRMLVARQFSPAVVTKQLVSLYHQLSLNSEA